MDALQQRLNAMVAHFERSDPGKLLMLTQDDAAKPVTVRLALNRAL